MQTRVGKSLFRRFLVYQRERFPLFSYGILVAVISGAGLTFSSTVRAVEVNSLFPTPYSAFVMAFLCAFGFFFQLRVADEFKDYADDRAYRPYRPVPRGVISLRELAVLALAVMGMQALLTLWRHPPLFWLLLLVWVYMGLMRYEFFVHDWLKAHLLFYMLSHLLILPLIFLFITAVDWLPTRRAPPGLGWFLGVGFFNGIVFEIGRKLRAPQDEEAGVETYSALWGRPKAVGAWLLAMLSAGICAGFAAQVVNFTAPVILLALVLWGIGGWLGWQFLQTTRTRQAKSIDRFSALWTIMLYGVLGIAPAFFVDF